ncbi:MAG: hypothetical protein V3S49_02630 [Thermodesulfobacteriota bacterium]
MTMMEKMMGRMMGRMSKEDKEMMMNGMMDKFFADMTVDDKKNMMSEMMPRMMQGINMMEMIPTMMMSMMESGKGMGGGMSGMMSKMKDGCEGMEKPEMAPMMMEMMPRCVTMMLPNISKEKRIDFALKMVDTLIDQGSAGMSEEEKRAFTTRMAQHLDGGS